MFTFQLTPRYSETDALGHITNTALPVWFEEARAPIFEIFMPGLGLEDWNLRVILYQVWKEWPRRRRYGAWAIQKSVRDLERDFWKRRDLIIYEMSIASFLAGIGGGQSDG